MGGVTWRISNGRPEAYPQRLLRCDRTSSARRGGHFCVPGLFPGGGSARQSWSSLLDRHLGSPFAATDSLLVSTSLFLFAAYVAGQLLSPYAKLVQRIGESELVQGIARSKFVQKIGKRLGFNPKPMPNAPSGAYDWLRCEGKRHIVLRRPQAAAYGHLVRQPLTEVAAIGSARCTGSGRRKPSTGAR